MSFDRYRPRLDTAPFAVLATHGPEGALDLVPCCFAIDELVSDAPASGEPSNGAPMGGARPELVTAVDHKPKRTARLARLANIERDPRVSLLVDHRDAGDWSRLWWVRAHGTARIVEDGALHRSAVDALVAKYPQYRERRPEGAVIRISVERWAGWSP